MGNTYYSDEIEINLMDLIFYLLKRWKTLIGAILLGAVIGGAFFMRKKLADVQTPPASVIEKYTVDPDVRSNMELAFQYRQLYAQQMEYNQNSFIMQMDPGEVYVGVLKYYVTAGEQTNPICEHFLGLLGESDMLGELKNAADLDCEEQYLNEIISASTTKNDKTVIAIDDGSVFDDAVVVYSVFFKDADSCQRMLDVIQTRAEALNRELQSVYGEYRFENIQKTVKLTINNDYLNRQKSYTDAVNTYLSNFTKIENAFEEDDLKYYKAVYLENEKPVEGGSESADIAEPGPQDNKKEVTRSVLIGIVILGVFWAAFYILKYIFDNRVKSAQELQRCYGLNLLGRIEYSKKTPRGVDKLLSEMNRKRKGNADTLEYIASMIKSLDVQHPLVCVDHTHQGAKTFVNALAEICTNMKQGDLLHQEGGTLEIAKSVDGVILTAVVGYTSQRQIRRDLDICRLQKIPVLGVLVIDNV